MTAPELLPPPNNSIIKKKGSTFPKIHTEEVKSLNNGKPHVDPRSRTSSRTEKPSWAACAAKTGLVNSQSGEKGTRPTFKSAGLITVAKQRMQLAVEDSKRDLYSPVEFDVEYPPKKLPFMGADVRQIGKYKSISTETVAVKQNDVHQVRLEKVRQDISRGKEKAKKEITRTLLMWHMESDNTVAQNPALERRTNRIVKFMDKMSNMSGPFHFTRSFYVDLADPEFDSISSPAPATTSTTPYPTLPANDNSFAPKSLASSPTPHAPHIAPPRPAKAKPNSRSTRMNTQPKAAPPPTKPPVKIPFSDCADANKISGYTQVKIYTDPYYRHLPPLSEASKRFDVRLARLPYKHVRNEKEWQNFLDVLNKPKEKPLPPKPPSPDFAAMNQNKMDSFRKRLPIISVMPRWQMAAKGGRLGRERISKVESEAADSPSPEEKIKKVDDSSLTLKKENSFIGFNKDSR